MNTIEIQYLSGIKCEMASFATAYHPRCDGMVEQMNRTLKAMFRKHTAQFGKQWDQFLPGVLWVY